MESIGNRLRAAREAKGLSVDDAAHQTRIQAILIGGLENDDYSNFPSTTYAKSFLSLYSQFLDVDASEALAQFSSGEAISLTGQGYLEAVTDNIEPRRPSSPYAPYRSSGSTPSRRRPSRANSPGMAPVFLGLVLVALMVAIPTLWLLGKDADSFDEAVNKGKELTNAAANLSTTETQGKKGETEAPKEPNEVEVNQGPPSPPAETEPVKTEVEPAKTKMAHVTPPDSERHFSASPSATESPSPVVTGAKPNQQTGNAATVVKARPVVTQEDPKPDNPNTGSGTGAGTGSSTNSTPSEPLRAVPLIARPLTIPEEGDPETDTAEESAETPEEEEETGTGAGGNQFPRPLD